MTVLQTNLGSCSSAVADQNAPSHVRNVQRRRREGADDATCPKCTTKAWAQTTEAGHTLYRCQNPACGKTWASDCLHKRETLYKTAGGVDMAKCTICGKRRKLPETKPKL